MAVPTGSSDADTAGESTVSTDESPASVSIHSTDPERALFIEDDNPDGWIATDLTVEPRR